MAFVAPLRPQPQDQAVIFSDDFDQPTDLRSRYFEYGDANGSFLRSADEGYAGSGAMKCQFEKGQVTAGNLKVVFGKNPFGKGVRRDETFRDIYWRVYVKHEAGWEGNPAKLARATSMAGRDWSQGLIAHVWGGKGDVLCIDPATGIRDNVKVTTRYNDFDHLRWLGVNHGQTPVFHPSESVRWVCVESRVKLNAPGQRDGAFFLWVDGRLEASRTDLDWHGTWDEYAINAVFLENYWNTGSVKRQARWFDNFVISTRPIGPIVAVETPAFTVANSSGQAWEAQVATDVEGEDVVWASRTIDGTMTGATIDAVGGTFSGSCAGQQALRAETNHWLRLRQRGATAAWSAWSRWHAPFRTRPFRVEQR